MRRLACHAPFALLLPLAALGCSGEPSRYAATGTVTMNGAPAPFVVLKFRLAFVLGTLMGGGIGIVVYLVLWVVMPYDDELDWD